MTPSKTKEWDSLEVEHRGYTGHFTFDEKKNIFYGRVANIQNVITFQGRSIQKAKQAFRDAINEHIEWSKKHGNN